MTVGHQETPSPYTAVRDQGRRRGRAHADPGDHERRDRGRAVALRRADHVAADLGRADRRVGRGGEGEGELSVRATGFNHVSIHALDLEQSVRFYTEVFGMEKIPTYTFAFPVQYLRLGDLQLHLFQRDGRRAGVPPHRHRRGRLRGGLRARAGARHRREGLVLRGHVRAARRQRADVPARPGRQPHRARLARRDDDRPHARPRDPQARRQRAADRRGPAGDAVPEAVGPRPQTKGMGCTRAAAIAVRRAHDQGIFVADAGRHEGDCDVLPERVGVDRPARDPDLLAGTVEHRPEILEERERRALHQEPDQSGGAARARARRRARRGP